MNTPPDIEIYNLIGLCLTVFCLAILAFHTVWCWLRR